MPVAAASCIANPCFACTLALAMLTLACANDCLGEFQAPFPPAVSHRLLLSALAAAIE